MRVRRLLFRLRSEGNSDNRLPMKPARYVFIGILIGALLGLSAGTAWRKKAEPAAPIVFPPDPEPGHYQLFAQARDLYRLDTWSGKAWHFGPFGWSHVPEDTNHVATVRTNSNLPDFDNVDHGRP